MTRWIMWIMLSFAAVVQAADPGGAKYLPMPPHFSLDAKAEQVLQDYPLGVINREAAFAHHGQAHNVVTLPNGLEGWVYENVLTRQEEFSLPSGEKRRVDALEHANVLSTYTLVFDASGKVVDVLFRDQRNRTAMSALLVQRQGKPDVDREPWRLQHREMHGE